MLSVIENNFLLMSPSPLCDKGICKLTKISLFKQCHVKLHICMFITMTMILVQQFHYAVFGAIQIIQIYKLTITESLHHKLHLSNGEQTNNAVFCCVSLFSDRYIFGLYQMEEISK